ncbi:MAG: MATE family efflux transporter [Lachnospiraceae bacterium]
MNRQNKLATMPIRPLLYTMAVPLMLSLLVQSLYNIVDSMFVARLSEDALTAASLVYSIQFLMIAVSVGTAVGLNALLSRKIGQQKTDEACRAATTGLFLTLFTSFLFSIAGIFFSDVIASKLTPDPTLQELCKQYLSINLVYCWGMFLQTYGQRLLQAVGDTVLSMLSLIIGAILNIILGIWRGNPKLSFYPTIHFPHQWHPLQPYLLLQVLHRGCIGTSVSPDGYDKPERFACTLWYAFGIR